MKTATIFLTVFWSYVLTISVCVLEAEFIHGWSEAAIATLWIFTTVYVWPLSGALMFIRFKKHLGWSAKCEQ